MIARSSGQTIRRLLSPRPYRSPPLSDCESELLFGYVSEQRHALNYEIHPKLMGLGTGLPHPRTQTRGFSTSGFDATPARVTID